MKKLNKIEGLKSNKNEKYTVLRNFNFDIRFVFFFFEVLTYKTWNI